MASRKLLTSGACSRVARVGLLALVLAFLLGASSAVALPALSWSAPDLFDGAGTPSAVSCASEATCVAVDAKGQAFTTNDPGASTPSWSASSIDAAGAPLKAVSCVASGLCVAVDEHGDALTQTGGSAWTSSSIDSGNSLEAVSCPAASLCVAVDDSGNLLSSSNPAGGHWSTASIDTGHVLRSVSCASVSLCVAVDGAGNALWSSEPTGGPSAWHARTIDFREQLRAVSCIASECVAVDASGQAIASMTPATASATWSATPIDTSALSALSCATSGVCVAVDGAGTALATDDAGALSPTWAATNTQTTSSNGISCLPGGLCVAVDSTGHSVSARVPGPAVSTIAAGGVGASSATLQGSFDPRDAQPSGCYFEYGTTAAYGSSVACSAPPSATGGAQTVTAALSGLASNTTYHYRLRAGTPSGSVVGADISFTTLLSSAIAAVTPHPSITGTPAVGQTLTCHSNVEASSVSGLAYAWLRDTVPVLGSTHSTYLVKGQDSGHHLQCQVTTTNGGGSASGKSSYVTIPVGGAPASAGETTIGTVSVHGHTLRVPLRCSAHASSGCAIVLDLSYGRSTLAYARVKLAAGTSRTVALSLTKHARRVLAAHRTLSAYLSVTGTVIGVIKARLARDLVTLGATGASAHVAALPLVVGKGASSTARAATAGLAQTPYMGWDTYFALGGRYSESTVLEEASELITLGLRSRGYRYVWLDVGWWHGAREADGQIEASSTQWPHGLPWLTSTLHAAGFRVGLYTDAGPNGCGGAGQGSYGHYQQDANTFAAWGFDAVKVDFCGGFEHQLEPRGAYTAFHEALADNASHRAMLLSICNFLLPEQVGEGEPAIGGSSFASYSFGPSVGNSWRTDTDVGSPGNVPFGSVLRNMDADAAAPQAAGPGHWNDPDYLAPGQGMNAAQFRTQMSMWSMLAAPLMVSDDLRKVGASSLSALQNSEVTAIDQDPAGVQGQLLSASGNGEVWVKPLADGERAVALLNRGSRGMRIATTAHAIGFGPAKSYRLRNLWSHTISSTGGTISFAVAPYSTVLLRASEG